jgi:hypothetical protein
MTHPSRQAENIWLAAGVRTPFAKVDGPLGTLDAIAMSVPPRKERGDLSPQAGRGKNTNAVRKFADYSDVCLRNSATSRAVICDGLLPKRAVT